jgi:hypothetical protein
VNQSAKDITAADLAWRRAMGFGGWARWRRERERAVRTATVAMGREITDGALKVPAPEDEHMVQALLTRGAHEALCDGVCLWRADGRLDDLRTLGTEDLVKVPENFASRSCSR